jgi:hypothetical protein
MMTKATQKLINLFDMTYISVGIAEGKLWRVGKDTFHTQGLKRWGGNNVFGIIFSIPNDQLHIRELDAYYNCSLSALLKNHIRDMNHRKTINVIPIDPVDLHNLATHQYTLSDPIEVWAWLGNKNNQSIKNRIKYDSNRITHGANVEAIKQAFQPLNN